MKTFGLYLLLIGLLCIALVPDVWARQHETKPKPAVSNDPERDDRTLTPAADGSRDVVALFMVSDPTAVEGLQIRLETEFGLRRIVDYALGSFSGFHLTVFRILGQQPADAVASSMNRIPGVIADRNTPLSVAGDPQASRQFSLRTSGVERAHSTLRGRNIVIGIVDAGVDSKHKDLGHALTTVESLVEGTPKVTPDIHGTAIAGIIGAGRDNNIGIVGLAPAARLLALQACVSERAEHVEATCLPHRVVLGIDRAIALGARIINLSLVGPPHEVINRAVIQAIYVHDVVVVTAAGNNGPAGSSLYPAAISGAMAVGATDSRGHLYARSNTRPHVNFLAPGVDVMSTLPKNRYAPQTGTSFAAANITGLMALLMEALPNVPPQELVHALRRSSVASTVATVGQMDVCQTLALFGKGSLCR